MDDFLLQENARNHRNHKLYERLVNLAFKGDASKPAVLVAHHITFTMPEGEPNEIPSADTLMFCHEFMRKVFGEENYVYAMMQLAARPVERRDQLLNTLLDHVEGKHVATAPSEINIATKGFITGS